MGLAYSCLQNCVSLNCLFTIQLHINIKQGKRNIKMHLSFLHWMEHQKCIAGYHKFSGIYLDGRMHPLYRVTDPLIRGNPTFRLQDLSFQLIPENSQRRYHLLSIHHLCSFPLIVHVVSITCKCTVPKTPVRCFFPLPTISEKGLLIIMKDWK